MNPMPLTPDWRDIAVRLAVALVASAVIGLDRGETGKTAGLRPTMLVCLAACLAMLQVNVLLPQAGKPATAFAVLDLMRLPLGILSGVGFIGAGAILRKGGLVTGLTTAATLWFVTVIGLCAGGGQIALAGLGTMLGLLILSGLKAVESRLPHRKRARLTVEDEVGSAALSAVLDELRQHRCHVKATGARRAPGTALLEQHFELHWMASHNADTVEQTITTFVNGCRNPAEWLIGE
jgi:putative Mg2+ transporter-C (MgtC) family protein